MSTPVGPVDDLLSESELDSLLEVVREDLVRDPGPVDVPLLARALRRQGRVLGAAATLQLTAQVRDHVDGLGPLQALTGPGVTDLLVNDDGSVWVDDADGLHRAPVRLGRAQARDLAVRLATSAGRRLDDAVPWADAHLPRSEEHTSELQSRGHLVCRLLLEKKKTRGLHNKVAQRRRRLH